MSHAPSPSVLFIIGALLFAGAGACSAADVLAGAPTKAVFREIGAYLLQGDENALAGTEPITDIFYFGATLSTVGRLTGAAPRPSITLKNGEKPRVYLVVSELSNAALMHFSLDPEYGVQPRLIDDIGRAADGYDGVQIDFESVTREDAAYFFAFLKGLRARLPAGKMLSVAVPARTKLVTDAYDYTVIAPIVDRLVIMAYDEHWSSSSPGPIASLPWCAKVADFAQSVVENGKIVMGLPLYGRAWQDKRLAKALRFENVQDIVAEKGSTPSYAPELGAWFEYSESVVVRVFFDDARTLREKLDLYRGKGISSVSFWRIGQGPDDLWAAIDQQGPPP